MKITTTNVLVCLSIAGMFNAFNTQVLFAEDTESNMTNETTKETLQPMEDEYLTIPEKEITLIDGSEITTQVFEEDLY